MIIQPYFPEPETVPGNIAAERHPIRIAFVRKVMGGYALAALLAIGVAWVRPEVSPEQPGLVLFVSLVLLTITRRLSGGGKGDRPFAMLVFPAVLVSLGLVLGNLTTREVWGCPALAALLLPIYTAVSGRDYSFVGAYALTFGMTAAAWAGLATMGWIDPAELIWAVLSAGVYLFFVTYDLASLLRRRRWGEEFEAVVDLFRDSLNIVTYSVRVWQHWRRFRI